VTSIALTLALALAFFLFADSIFTPLILLFGKQIWLLILKVQAMLTKKNLLQALVQSLVLAGKALLRLINKTLTAWILPLLMTRRQRYWLYRSMEALKRWTRMRYLRGRVIWRRQSLLVKVLTLAPAMVAAVALFVVSGFLIATLFGVSFVVPWLGSLPLAAIVFLRRQLARLALYVFERMGVGTAVNKIVDWMIDLVWWRTPEPIQRRFDAWWRRLNMRLRRWVIGPRRKVTRRLGRFRLNRKTNPSAGPDEVEKEAGGLNDHARS
jgi:hypothetical protein